MGSFCLELDEHSSMAPSEGQLGRVQNKNMLRCLKPSCLISQYKSVSRPQRKVSVQQNQVAVLLTQFPHNQPVYARAHVAEETELWYKTGIGLTPPQMCYLTSLIQFPFLYIIEQKYNHLLLSSWDWYQDLLQVPKSIGPKSLI